MKKISYRREVEPYQIDEYRPLPHIDAKTTPESGILTGNREKKTSEYQEALRQGVVAHIDRIAWRTCEFFTKRTKKKFIEILTGTYQVGRPKYHGITDEEGETRRNILEHRVVLPYDEVTVILEWGRIQGRSPRSTAQAFIGMTWRAKGDYSLYSQYLREMEVILLKLGIKWELCYAEVSLDSTNDEISSYLFNHTLLRGGRADQIMDCLSGKNRRLRAGIRPSVPNTYQNNKFHYKQLVNYQKTGKKDYVDMVNGNVIRRSELKCKRKILDRYGVVRIDDLMSKMMDIYQGEVLWKKRNDREVERLGFSEEERKNIIESPVIYWIWKLVKKGISIKDARNRYCENTAPIEPILVI
jgi:hypothetical protein